MYMIKITKNDYYDDDETLIENEDGSCYEDEIGYNYETAEVEKTYTELDNLKAENMKLIEKNTSLTEANSKLFMQIGVEKSGGEKLKHTAPMDLRKLGI